jgi:hypothetical protein
MSRRTLPQTVAKAREAAIKSGHRAFVVAGIRQVGEGPTPEQREQTRKADLQKLQGLLQPFVERYGREQLIEAVRVLTAPPPRHRGRPSSPHAASMAAELFKEVERRRAAGSRRPVKDIYETIFVDERQSPEHFANWRKQFRKLLKRRGA